VKKETVLLATVAAVCGFILTLALVMRPWDRPAAGGGGGTAPPEAAVAGGGAPPEGESADAAPAAANEAEAPSFTSEQNRREVALFFQEADSEYLGAEQRKIFLTSSLADQAKQIVVELINGPQEPGLLPTLPPQTRLRGLYLDRSGTAYVDLSSEVADLHPGGTGAEIATIYSLVDSLTYNLPEIKRVRLLVNGEERETLKNHLDLRRYYRKDLSIVNMDRKGAP
jgi:germination protein M